MQSVDGLKIGITTKLWFVIGKWTCIICNFFLQAQFVLKYGGNPKLQLTTLMFRCQIAVHQECYGVRGKQDFTSWVCRACEKPEQKRECCLCPVKGNPCAFDNCSVIPFFGNWVHLERKGNSIGWTHWYNWVHLKRQGNTVIILDEHIYTSVQIFECWSVKLTGFLHEHMFGICFPSQLPWLFQ